MPRVVEVRVHGVGGTPPEALLGEDLPADLVRVGGDGKSAFFARLSQRNVEGYVWGPLTSSGLMQPLWIFLLPFTLLNVAGWTLPSQLERQRKIWAVARWLVMLAGLALTLDYVFGTSMLVMRQVFFQWRLGGLIKSRAASIWLGGVALLLLGLLVFVLAKRKQREFEAFHYESSDAPQGGLLEKVGGAAEAERGLAADRFWNSDRASRALLRLHALVASAGFLLLFVTALKWGGQRWLGWAPYFKGLLLANAVILVILLLVCLFVFGNPFRWLSTPRFRVVAPWSLTMASVGLATGMFGGAGLLLARTLPLPNGRPIPNGLELDLTLAFGAGASGAALVALMVGAHLLGRATTETKQIISSGKPPKNENPVGTEPNGVPPDRLPAVGLARALSEFGRNADLLITIPAAVFALFAVPSVMNWLDLEQPLPLVPIVFLTTSAITLAFFSARPVLSGLMPLVLVALPLIATITTAMLEETDRRPDRILQVTPDQIAQLGGILALAGVSTFLGFWVRGYFNPGQRRLVAILWDVLTFFPRRFHPLAVRPYAERAVPELIGRLCDHVRKGRRVILSAHSQGSILAFAALSQLRRLDDQSKRRDRLWLSQVAFVTYGCPFTQLHARVFPSFFTSTVFAEMKARLFAEKVTVTEPGGWLLDETTHPASWRNFYRLTDYIGKQVYIGEDWELFNQILPDPPEAPMVSTVPFDAIFEGKPDPFRAPWVAFSRHSHYNSDPALKIWIRTLRKKLESAPS